MRKVGGSILIGISVCLILFAIVKVWGVLNEFLTTEQFPYGNGFVIGQAIVVILLIALGMKFLQKGKSLFKGPETIDAEPESVNEYKESAGIFIPLGIIFITLGFTTETSNFASNGFIISGVTFLIWSLFCWAISSKRDRVSSTS